MNYTRIALYALLAAVAAHTVAAEAADGSIEARAKAAIERGLDWMLAQQQTNGVWSSAQNPALTAMPAWALSASGRPQDLKAIEKAVAFIKGCAQPDGGIYVIVPGRRGGTYGTYNTAICMTSLHYCDNAGSTRILQKAREYVASTQLTGQEGENNGGFGYEAASSPRAGGADLNNSAWVISAMALTQDVEEKRPAGEKRADIDWEAALGYVDRMQVKPDAKGANPDDAGGFLYRLPDKGRSGPPSTIPMAEGKPPAGRGGQEGGRPAGGPTPGMGRPMLRSYGSITYSGLLSMLYARVGRDDPRVVSAVDYARRHWTLDENPGQGQQGIYFYYTIMARALALLDVNELPPAEDGGTPIAWRDQLIEKVISLQKEDGSWANENNRWFENDSVLTSSYAILTLEYALRMFK
jgi:squalene-hopene/tetraprenyl-beta-curcumene cyclase